jgi:hypothetical protein
LFAAAHEDDAFDGIIVIFGFVLEAKDAEARRVTDFNAANVADTHGSAIVAGDNDLTDVVGRCRGTAWLDQRNRRDKAK